MWRRSPPGCWRPEPNQTKSASSHHMRASALTWSSTCSSVAPCTPNYTRYYTNKQWKSWLLMWWCRCERGHWERDTGLRGFLRWTCFKTMSFPLPHCFLCSKWKLLVWTLSRAERRTSSSFLVSVPTSIRASASWMTLAVWMWRWPEPSKAAI